MKKAMLLVALSSLFLFGCQKQQNDTKHDTSKQETELSSVEDKSNNEEKINAENISKGIFSNKEYTLKYVDSQIIKSPYIDKDGLYVTYELTNESDQNIMPFQAIEQLELSQQTDNQIVKLDSGYSAEDAFGEDMYNEIIDRNNANNNQLLPHKTMTAYEAYFIEDKTKPVKITVYSQSNNQPIGEFEFTPKQQ